MTLKVSVGRQVVKENGGNVRGGSLALNDFLFTSIKREKDTGDGRRIPARRAELGDKWVNLASILPVSPENGWKRLKDEWKETEDTVFLSYLMCPLLPSHLSSISFFHPNSRTERQRETKLCALQGAGMLFPWPRK